MSRHIADCNTNAGFPKFRKLQKIIIIPAGVVTIKAFSGNVPATEIY